MDTLPGVKTSELKGHEGPVNRVRFNTQGSYCLSCGKDRTVRLWNPHKGILVKKYMGHGYDVRDVTVVRDNSKFASCGGDRQVFLYDVASSKVIRKFRGHDGVVNAVKFTANDDVLVSAGFDQAVKVWDCKSNSYDPIQAMKDFKDSVTSVAISGWDIIASSVDGTVHRYDVRLGRCIRDNVHHPITSVVTSNDGLCMLLACLDSCLRLLDKSSGEVLASYTGHVHQGVQMDCTLTPDDAYVIGSSEDGIVYIWDLVEANVLKKLHAHSGPVCSLAMHPKGSMLLSSSTDGSIAVWTHEDKD